MTQVTLKLMDLSPYLYAERAERERKSKVNHGKSSEKMVTDQHPPTRLSVQVSCNNSTRLIDKPIRRVRVRGVPRLQNSTRFLDCRDSFTLNVRI